MAASVIAAANSAFCSFDRPGYIEIEINGITMISQTLK
jgi:hypothetical protein